VENKLKDEYTTPLGIRTFSFDAEKGFFLNDVPTKIKGVCMHHDLGCLGAAANAKKGASKLSAMAKGRKRKYNEDGTWTWFYPDADPA
jgi:beta-galactosidase/beta-glucuronidase